MAEKKKKTEKEVIKEEETVTEKSQEEQKEEVKVDSEKEKLEKELSDTKDKLLRTLAEYDNFRKRSQKEKEAIYSDSKSDVISKLLSVIDNFERAGSNTQSDYDTYKKGIEMTVAQLLEVFKTMGVEAFGEVGEAFDPNMHNAVMHVEDENLAENSIADVFLKGYKLGDRVIRPATVKVAN